MNVFYKYINCKVLCGLLLALSLHSCVADKTAELIENKGKVYLSITRNQFAQGNINQDKENYEDRVHNIAVLVFNSQTGELADAQFDPAISLAIENKAYLFELTPGDHDFYFIANTELTALHAISSVKEMEAYIEHFQLFDSALRTGATDQKGFPMAKIYRKESVAEGGTIVNPLPFLPNGEHTVGLVRTVAKVALHFTGDLTQIESVNYVNAHQQFNFESAVNTEPQLGNHILKGSEGEYVFYTPECILESREWTTHQSIINYITVKLKNSNKLYQIPLVANGDYAANYLKFARGLDLESRLKPNYSVERNQYYKLSIKLPSKPAADFEVIKVKVLPWQWFDIHNYDNEESRLPEDEYPTISVDDYDSFINNNTLIIGYGKPSAPISFWLKKPVEAKWKATLSNGLHFQFVKGSDSGAATADPLKGKKEVLIEAIAPLKDLTHPVGSEVYLTVNNKEIPLQVKVLSTGEVFNFYGAENRLKVVQID